MLLPEFQSFYRNWIRKAEEYGTEELHQCFDKFFTLYVVYNRLYAEMTFLLVRKGEVTFKKGRSSFPDSKAAKDYVRNYLGSSDIVNQLEEDLNTKQSLHAILKLIEEGTFHIKLDVMTGNRQKEADKKLLNSLRSIDEDTKALAILDYIYSIRCNMFHGHKGFNEIQVEILKPTIILLQKIVTLLYEKLSTERN